MKLRDIIATASANLLRSKLRTFLTIVAIFIGAFTLTITSGIGAGISDYINQQLGNLGASDVLIVQSGGSSRGDLSAPKKYDPHKQVASSSEGSLVVLTQSDIDKIKAHSGVTAVVPERNIAADYIAAGSSDKYQLNIVQNIRGSHLDLAAGKDVDDSASQYQLVLPAAYLSSLGFADAQAAVGQTVTIGLNNALGEQKTQSATIVGVQQRGIIGGGSLIANDALVQQLYDTQNHGLPTTAKEKYVAVEAIFADSLSAQQVDSLKTDLKNQGYEAQTVQDRIGTFKTVIQTIIYVLDTFAIIALLAASFGIINTLLMAVQERTKEIGLMKAMGMGKGRIFLLFSIEAIMIGFWGSLAGVGIAYGLGTLVDHILSKGLLKDLPGLHIVAFPPRSIIGIVLIIMAIAFLAGTLPARRAAKLNPIDALRYE